MIGIGTLVSVLLVDLEGLPSLSVLTNYGVLGLFSGIMLLVIKYLIKDYKERLDSIIKDAKENLQKVVAEKDIATSAFNTYLMQKEDMLLKIIADNTLVFKDIAVSIQANADATKKLIESAERRDNMVAKIADNVTNCMSCQTSKK